MYFRKFDEIFQNSFDVACMQITASANHARFPSVIYWFVQ